VQPPLLIDWAGREFVQLRPGIHAATVLSDDLTVSMYRYEPGSRWEEHSHPEDQLTIVISGEIVFRTPDGELRLRPGQQALIPGGLPHAAEVGDAEVSTLNVWPPRGSGRP
jgi:quercetin dioxygenase-like cupin family protein